MKTVRFTELVAASGKPEVHLTWLAPARDQVLQNALKQHRVLTVHQRTRGAKKDFAVVGLDKARDSQFLIFRKSLRRFENRHVVGIRYDLLDEAGLVASTYSEKISPLSNLPEKQVDKVAHFPVSEPMQKDSPAPFDRDEKRESRPKPSKVEVEPEETDPIKEEIRHALAELTSGQQARAVRRLRRLLRT